MFSIPAHKQIDPMKKPGQIKRDVTLADYIARKQDKPKMNFDQYREIHFEDYDPWDWDMIELGWKLAQENM